MYTINSSSRFEWDDQKAARNEVKHGVSFEEATTVFDDPDGIAAHDEAHSNHEIRQWYIGESALSRMLVVVFTERTGPTIRLISARPAKRKERRFYEQSNG